MYLCSVPLQADPPILTKAVSSGRPALRVTWTAPSSDHLITEYQVQYIMSGSISFRKKNVTSTSTTLENLSAATSYQVRVRAFSDIGSGPYSEIRNSTTYQGTNSIAIIYTITVPFKTSVLVLMNIIT